MAALIVVVIIAVVGWLITHVLTLRAQNQSFVNQIVLVSLLLDYQGVTL